MAMSERVPPPGRDADAVGGVQDPAFAGGEAVRGQNLPRRARGHAGEARLAARQLTRGASDSQNVS